jgi:hypothetical protein
MAYDTASKSLKEQAPVAKGIDPERVLKEFTERFPQAKRHQREWREEARMLYDLKAGHQMSPEDEAAIDEKYDGSYPKISFNVTDKYCSAVEGLQVNNRQEMRFYPREEGDAGIDEFSTGVVKWCRDQSEAEDEETDAFGDLFLTGLGWIEHYLEDEEDPESPYIGQDRIDPLDMYYDGNARKKNLVDRRWDCRMKGFSEDEFEEKFGEQAWGQFEPMDDATVQHVTQPDDYGTRVGGSAQPARIWVADYQFSESVQHWIVTANLPNPDSGEMAPMREVVTKSDWRVMKQALESAGIPYESERVSKRCYYRAWIRQDRILGKVRELKCGFTREAMTGKRDRNRNTPYGIGRVIKDPQLWLNKFFASILYTLMVNAKGGLMAEEDSFEDPSEAERTWANPSSITFTTPGAVSGGKIQPKPPAPYPAGMESLMRFTMDILPGTSGISPELLGLADRDQPGILEAQRKQSAMAIIAWVFDAMRRYYKRSGKLMLSMIAEYLNEGQLIRISGEEGAKYVRLIKDKLVRRFDTIVDESPTSVNMQERAWVSMKEAIPMGAQLGAPPPPSAIKYIPGLPAEFKAEWMKSLQDPEKQKQAQEGAEIAKQQAQAEIAKNQTQAQLNAAKAEQIQAETQMEAQSRPISDALAQMQALKTAADAGAAQAGGN